MDEGARPDTAEVRLSDGSAVLVRPVDPDDKERIRSGFDRLGPESRYRRFLSPMPELGDSMLRYLTEVDHHDHEALIALDPDSGHGVGIARFVRTRPGVAEVAVTVADDWQGRRLGTILLELLAARARAEAVSRFSALVLSTNADMIDLMRRLGSMQVVGRDGGSVELEVELPPTGLHAGLRELLHEAADAHSPVEPALTLAADGARRRRAPPSPAA